MGLLKKFAIDTSFDPDNPDSPYYNIAPGAIATSPNRIYIPATNQKEEVSRMLVYDYGGNDLDTDGQRKLSEEFYLSFTRGVVYGGSTWYNGEIWTVTDEQKENRFIGCVERYSESGVKNGAFSLPWMWGYEEFIPLGITVEQNLIFILTKRTGWLNGQKLEKSYQIEKYNTNGDLEDIFKLQIGNKNPVGLTDTELCLYVGDASDNKLYGYDNKISLDEEKILDGAGNSIEDGYGNTLSTILGSFDFELGNFISHGIGFNGESFGILKVEQGILDGAGNSIEDGCGNLISSNIEPYIFIYRYRDGNIIFDEDGDDDDGIIEKDGAVDHRTSLISRLNRQFGNIGKYGKKMSVVRLDENDIDFDICEWIINGASEDKITFYFGPAADFLTASNLENEIFGTLDFFKFIPQRTLPGLRKGDLIVGREKVEDSNDYIELSSLPATRFQIVGFRESANGHTQTIYCQRVG